MMNDKNKPKSISLAFATFEPHVVNVNSWLIDTGISICITNNYRGLKAGGDQAQKRLLSHWKWERIKVEWIGAVKQMLEIGSCLQLEIHFVIALINWDTLPRLGMVCLN